MQRLQTGDTVMVVGGAHKGKTGKVKQLLLADNRVVIEGINVIKRHVKPTPQRPGGVLEREAPIHMSNVMPVDPETGKPTRVRFQERDGQKVRVAKSGAVITAAR